MQNDHNGNAITAPQTKKRIDWVDCAKGIAIILVLIGHTVTFDTESQRLARGIIFSFHMPLFFVLAGITLSIGTRELCKKKKKRIQKACSGNTVKKRKLHIHLSFR